MIEISGGEVLARCLASEGIRFVFGLPCPEIDPLLAAPWSSAFGHRSRPTWRRR
jgi:thiamine pyrophosphate-dependent acetolactate synthase large subunit-like protein